MSTKIGQLVDRGWRPNLANGKSMFADSFVARKTAVPNDKNQLTCHKVHKFRMGDVEDPDLYVAQPIYEWQQTEQGKWVMKHGSEHQYHMHMAPVHYGYEITITAYITAKRWTEYCLRFPLDV